MRYLHSRWYHHGRTYFPESLGRRTHGDLARSSPQDKKILVETLKNLGEIVGVTGDGTHRFLDGHCWHSGCEGGVGYHSHGRQLRVDRLCDYVGPLRQRFRSQAPLVPGFSQHHCRHHHLRLCCGLFGGYLRPSIIQLLSINVVVGTFAALALHLQLD